MYSMAQILTKNPEKIKKSEMEKIITGLIIHLRIPPIHFNRVLNLFNHAREIREFNQISNKILLAICFYRLNLEKVLYISLSAIKDILNIRTPGFLSNHLRLYEKFIITLNLKPIYYTLNDHISNICDKIQVGDEIKKKAINLIKMIKKNFLLVGETRTCAIASVYFASNFCGVLLFVDQFAHEFDLISPSVLYVKIRIFETYMKKYFSRKAHKKSLTNRESYFLEKFSIKHRIDFFRKFRNIKN